MKTDLIVALDVSSAGEARDLTLQLQDLPLIYKVGSELFLPEGARFISELHEAGARVFLDLKFHDIPRTVAAAAAQAARMGVAMFTVHLTGGREMISAVREELEKLPKARRPVLLGVSVLTSHHQTGWDEIVTSTSGSKGIEIGSAVSNLARKAVEWGADGLVCSAHELEALGELKSRLYTVVPGIRPTATLGAVSGDDQARVTTPGQAARLGAGAIVVGRPITQASDPRASVQAILRELADTGGQT